MKRVEVLFFAAAREASSVERASLELPVDATVADVVSELSRAYPLLVPLLPHLRTALNFEFVSLSTNIPPNSQVALIPPVSGGDGRFWLTQNPLHLEDVVNRVSALERGGIVTFVGKVRHHTRGKPVVRLEYEAYVPMALKALEAIAKDLEQRWPGTCLSVGHRYGVLFPGDTAVVMAAAAPHRKEAFGACEQALERLKQEVPIWKKEFYEDGHVWVGLGP